MFSDLCDRSGDRHQPHSAITNAFVDDTAAPLGEPSLP
jgi:hypothetical protein